MRFTRTDFIEIDIAPIRADVSLTSISPRSSRKSHVGETAQLAIAALYRAFTLIEPTQ